MKEWWKKKKQKTRKARKDKVDYTIWDGILDILFWVPEVLIFPFRLLFWMFRGFGRVLDNIIDWF